MTDRRLLFVKDGVMSQVSEDFPYDKVSSVQWASGFVQGTITVFASGNKAEIKNVDKEDGKGMVDALRDRLNAPTASPGAAAPAPAPVAASATPDPFEQLRKLGELRDAGILSTEEFEAKKAEILSRL